MVGQSTLKNRGEEKMILLKIVAYGLFKIFASYVGLLFIACCLIAIQLGNRKYYLKKNQIYDRHSIKINRLLKKSRLGRRVKNNLKESDIPGMLLGLCTAIVITVFFLLRFHALLVPETMFVQTRVFVTLLLVSGVMCSVDVIIAWIYRICSDRVKHVLAKKII